MAYDENLAERVRETLEPGTFAEIKMFGGLCFTVNGNMAVGVTRDDLMVRVGPDGYDDALAQPGARPMDFTKKPLKGFVFVDGTGTGTDPGLEGWVARGVAFATSLPPKKAKKKKPSAR